MSASLKGCKFEHTFNDECTIVKETQDANLLSQESKLKCVNFKIDHHCLTDTFSISLSTFTTMLCLRHTQAGKTIICNNNYLADILRVCEIKDLIWVMRFQSPYVYFVEWRCTRQACTGNCVLGIQLTYSQTKKSLISDGRMHKFPRPLAVSFCSIKP